MNNLPKNRKCFLCGLKKNACLYIGCSCSEWLSLLYQLSNKISVFLSDKTKDNQDLVLSLINQIIDFKTNTLINETHQLCAQKNKITKLCESFGVNYNIHKYIGVKRKHNRDG